MINLSVPRIKEAGSRLRLSVDVKIDNTLCEVWFEVEKEFGQYLCYERADAFVVGLLNYAMRNGHDIESEAPMGEFLYYQITTALIPAVSKGGGNEQMYPTKIICPIDTTELPNAHAVGTGISCGIDSLHVLANNADEHLPHHKLTHLAFNNVGSHGEGAHAEKLYHGRLQAAENFCKEYGYKLVKSNSNIMNAIPQSHLLTHTYTSCFAILCLQKLYAVYYYASGVKMAYFSLKDNATKDCAYYDLLLTSAFSTEKLKIYSEGGALSRLEKMRTVVEYTPSYKYLNVCIATADNCCRCEKCTRTLLALDVLGKLEAYRDVFDIDYYKQHKLKYMKALIAENALHNQTYAEMYPYLKSQISFLTKLQALPLLCKRYLQTRLSDGTLRTFFERLYHSFRKG